MIEKKYDYCLSCGVDNSCMVCGKMSYRKRTCEKCGGVILVWKNTETGERNMKPFLGNCAMCNEPVIRDGTGCHCKCHDESMKRYLKNKGLQSFSSVMWKW